MSGHSLDSKKASSQCLSNPHAQLHRQTKFRCLFGNWITHFGNDRIPSTIQRNQGSSSTELIDPLPRNTHHVLEAFPGKGQLRPFEAEFARLRRALAVVGEERDILKKVVDILSVPPSENFYFLKPIHPNSMLKGFPKPWVPPPAVTSGPSKRGHPKGPWRMNG